MASESAAVWVPPGDADRWAWGAELPATRLALAGLSHRVSCQSIIFKKL